VVRLVDAIAPPRLGPGFRWLLASSWTTNLADGVALAAGPLLVASQTRSPMLVATAALLQRLPWLLFGLYAGVVADRLDRRFLIVAVDAIRAVVVAILTLTILTDVVTVWIVLVALFLLGVSEVFADTTSQTMLPMVVDDAGLGVGNARSMFGHITINQLAGPPIGAALFGVGMAWPFGVQVVTLALGALLASRITYGVDHVPDERTTVREEIVAGMRWTWHHGPVRILTLTIVLFNVTFGAAWGVLVLYATERLGLDELGFGLLTAMVAVGGVIGTTWYGPVERSLGSDGIMRVGLVVETLTHLSLALTRSPVVAFVTMFVFGIHTGMWGTTVHTVRQRQVPLAFQGRVGSVYLLAMQGGLVVGAPIGGLLARWFGLSGPFWFAFVGSVALLVWIWPRLADLTSVEPVREAIIE
jgi:MFS family permease